MQADRQARWFARAKADPAFLAKRAARERARRQALKSNPARAAEELAKALDRQRARRGSIQRQAPFAGSVLAAAADSPGRSLLATLAALAPRHDDRDEVIAEAAVLVLQGAAPAYAVKAAAAKVSRDTRAVRNAVRIEECGWI